MDWFLYDNDLRHERVKSLALSNIDCRKMFLAKFVRCLYAAYPVGQGKYRGLFRTLPIM